MQSLINYYAVYSFKDKCLKYFISKIIVSHCIAHFYGIDIRSLRLIKFVLHSIRCIKPFLIFLRRAVLVRCMPDIIFAVFNQSYRKTYKALCRNSIIGTLYTSWLIRFKMCNHWTESLYIAEGCKGVLLYCVLCFTVFLVSQQLSVLSLFILLMLLYLYSILSIYFYCT